MKVGMVSLGCPKNQVDAEVMMGLLKEAGHSVTAVKEDADAIIVNTCSFIREAIEESIEAILEMGELKEKDSLKFLIATGCLAQRYKAGLLKELPEVDAYLGTGEFDKVAEVLDSLEDRTVERKAHRIPAPKYIYSHDTPRLRFTPRHWSYLKIAEGCDNRCSYCVIPSLRGRLRSRGVTSIKQEARAMAAGGVKEICLVAQDTTAYGADLKSGATLASLLKDLEGIKKLEWLRVLYTHPAHITDELVELYAGSGKVVSYFDMPIQHIDSAIMKTMGRKVSEKSVRLTIDKIRKKVPGAAIRTSLMVGFPGETHEKFLKLLRFVKEVEFDHLGVFAYSPEEGTPAYDLKGWVSDELKLERRDQLMKAQSKISMKKNRARVGGTYRVLVDGPSKESDLLISGRAYFQAPEVDGEVFITEGDVRPGEFADVEITEAHPYDLVGRAVGPAPR